MIHQDRVQINPGAVASVSNERRPSDEELSRLADLIASGSVQFPEDLDSSRERQLAAYVVHRRRQRLIKYIARAIATDLLRNPNEISQEVRS